MLRQRRQYAILRGAQTLFIVLFTGGYLALTLNYIPMGVYARAAEPLIAILKPHRLRTELRTSSVELTKRRVFNLRI